MFIYTIYGMFSVASLRSGDGKPGNPIDPQKVMVRARTRGHLESLLQRFPTVDPHSSEIIESQKSDYRARIVLDKRQWGFMLVDLTDEISYDKVKPAMHAAGVDGLRDDGPINYDALIMAAFMEGQVAQDRAYPPQGRINYAGDR